MDMKMLTVSQEWQKVRATNTTDSSFPSRIDTATEPSGIGDAAAQTTSAIIKLRNASSTVVPNVVLIKPFGAGSDTNTFSVRVIGWDTVGSNAPSTKIWTPTVLAQVACTLTVQTGVTGKIIAVTDRYCDTLSLTYPTTAIPSIELVTNAADLAAFFKVDIVGFAYLELTFTTGSSATNCNAMVKFI